MTTSLTTLFAACALLLDPASVEIRILIFFVAFCALVGFDIYWIVKRAKRK